MKKDLKDKIFRKYCWNKKKNSGDIVVHNIDLGGALRDMESHYQKEIQKLMWVLDTILEKMNCPLCDFKTENRHSYSNHIRKHRKDLRLALLTEGEKNV